MAEISCKKKNVSLVKHKTVLVNKKQFTAMCSILWGFFLSFLKKYFHVSQNAELNQVNKEWDYNLHSAQIIKVKFFHRLIWVFFFFTNKIQ